MAAWGQSIVEEAQRVIREAREELRRLAEARARLRWGAYWRAYPRRAVDELRAAIDFAEQAIHVVESSPAPLVERGFGVYDAEGSARRLLESAERLLRSGRSGVEAFLSRLTQLERSTIRARRPGGAAANPARLRLSREELAAEAVRLACSRGWGSCEVLQRFYSDPGLRGVLLARLAPVYGVLRRLLLYRELARSPRPGMHRPSGSELAELEERVHSILDSVARYLENYLRAREHSGAVNELHSLVREIGGLVRRVLRTVNRVCTPLRPCSLAEYREQALQLWRRAARIRDEHAKLYTELKKGAITEAEYQARLQQLLQQLQELRAQARSLAEELAEAMKQRETRIAGELEALYREAVSLLARCPRGLDWYCEAARRMAEELYRSRNLGALRGLVETLQSLAGEAARAPA